MSNAAGSGINKTGMAMISMALIVLSVCGLFTLSAILKGLREGDGAMSDSLGTQVLGPISIKRYAR